MVGWVLVGDFGVITALVWLDYMEAESGWQPRGRIWIDISEALSG